MEKINPMVLNVGDETYTLEFSRDSVRFAEQRGFKISELTDFPLINIPAFFFYAFRMHHPSVSRAQTDKILFEEMGGLGPDELSRLAELYAVPQKTLLRQDERKNAKVSIQM